MGLLLKRRCLPFGCRRVCFLGQVLVDVVVRELENIPADDGMRVDYDSLLARLLDQSEWATRGGRYREEDIKRVAGGRR